MSSTERTVGTVSRGIRCPIIRRGDDIAAIVTKSVLDAAKGEGFALRDRDVIAVTESVVARAQGNYATVEHIAADVRAKLGGGTVGVVFPILSRNRFAILLRGIAKGCRKVVIQLSYPSDEVGNALTNMDAVDAAGVDPYRDVLTGSASRSTSSPASTTSPTTPSWSRAAALSARSSLPTTRRTFCSTPTTSSPPTSTPARVPNGS